MLPPGFLESLGTARRVLLAGCGGGYDVMGAVPLLVELRERGLDVHLASLSFTYLDGLTGAFADPEVPNLYEVPAQAATRLAYCPEAWLSRFMEKETGRPQPIWCFDKTGVRPLRRAYDRLRESLSLDAIVLVDGGIDALLRGDETSLGTPSEDMTSLAAVAALEGIPRLLVCVGMGAEMRDGISHAQAFERIAELTREGGYLGASGLTLASRAGDVYARALRYTFENQPGRKSHVHRVVLSALEGGFGSEGPHIWISPLMTLLWCFDLSVVARTNLMLSHLSATETIWDVVRLVEGLRSGLGRRDWDPIPI